MIRVAGSAEALGTELADDAAAKLAKLAQDGDQAARDTLAHSLMGLALSIAGSYSRNSRWTVEEEELQGVAFETMLRYGIDRYSPAAGIPVRTWVALVVRRKLALAVDRAQQRADRQVRYAEEREVQEPTLPWDENPQAELDRLLQWAQGEHIISPQQVSVLALRGKGLLFETIGKRLGIHRKEAGREYAAGLEALAGSL